MADQEQRAIVPFVPRPAAKAHAGPGPSAGAASGPGPLSGAGLVACWVPSLGSSCWPDLHYGHVPPNLFLNVAQDGHPCGSFPR